MKSNIVWRCDPLKRGATKTKKMQLWFDRWFLLCLSFDLIFSFLLAPIHSTACRMASPAELRRAPTTLARSKRNFSKNCQTKKKGKKKENRNTQRPELKLLGRTLVFFSFFFGASDESITKRSSRNKKYKKKAFFFLFKAFRGPVRGPPRPPFSLFLNLFNSIRVSSSARLSVVKKKPTRIHWNQSRRRVNPVQ